MNRLFLKKIVAARQRISFEIFCLVCCLLGYFKVRLRFDPARLNRLEIGAARSRKDGFLVLDLDLKAQYPFDLRAGLPFPDASIDFIYAEHVLEHFDHVDLVTILAECRRVLRPGGGLSVCVPDATPFLAGYHDPERFERARYLGGDASLDYDSRLNLVNYMFYMGGHHRHMFDQESLLQELRSAGFHQVRAREYDAALDQECRRHESIYAQCLAPGATGPGQVTS